MKTISRILPFLGPAFNLPGGISPAIIFSAINIAKSRISIKLINSLFIFTIFCASFLLAKTIEKYDINVVRYITSYAHVMIGLIIIHTYKAIYEEDLLKNRIGRQIRIFIAIFFAVFLMDLVNGDSAFFFLHEKQDLSVLHGNVNNQALFFLIAYCLAESSNCKKESLALLIIGSVYSLLVSARMVSILFIIQFFYFRVTRTFSKTRAIIFHLSIICIGIVAFEIFKESFYITIFSLQDEFERGNIYSDSLRLHYTTVMIDIIRDFNAVKHSIGIGMGQLSIVDPNTSYNFASPHNLYMELYITGGLFIYWLLFYYPIFQRKDKIRSLMTFMKFIPSILAIISLSSGIYYFGFYLLISLISYQTDEFQKHKTSKS